MRTEKDHKLITAAAIAGVIVSLSSPLYCWATAEVDTDKTREPANDKAPPPVSSEDRDVNDDAAPAPSSATFSPTGSVETPTGSKPGQPTYPIRLPLATPGSVIPKIETGSPTAPPPNVYMPRPTNSEFNRPVAWRAVAEAIRTQQPSNSLIVLTMPSEFKASYNAIIKEAQATGWSMAALSLPAGHFLMKIPKTNDPADSDDAAAWLILAVSPIDQTNTEVRIKIQSRRTSTFAPQVSGFLKRCQMRATGNELL